ncbi:MAG: type II secretion system F family protein [Patescibacteria group bacterium]
MANNSPLSNPSFSIDQPRETFTPGAENNASGVGKSTQGSTMASNTQNASQPIRLNIAEIEFTKRLIQEQKLKQGKITGNPILDLFYAVNDWMISHSSVDTQEKATFFRLLSVMLNAGVPLIRSLDTLSAQMAKSVRLSRIVLEIARKVENGGTLSEGLRGFPDLFSDAEVGMVRSGEATGQLNQILSDIATQLEQAASLRSKVLGALIYPGVVMTLLVGVVFVMMVAVVPRLTDFFTQSGKALPVPTQILISTSNFFQSYWILMIGGLVGTVLLVNLWIKTPMGRYEWDSMKLRVPLIGKLLQKSILAQFMRQFSDLLGSGIQVTQALRITAGAVKSAVYQKRLELAAQDVEQGIPLAETLNDPRLFPDMVLNMIQVGEQTAHLETVCEKVAQFYDDEVDALVKGLTKAFEPIMLIVIGIVVGGMVAAVMLPIMDLSNVGNV